MYGLGPYIQWIDKILHDPKQEARYSVSIHGTELRVMQDLFHRPDLKNVPSIHFANLSRDSNRDPNTKALKRRGVI